MCEVCVQQARRDFANWPESQQRIARIAVAGTHDERRLSPYEAGRDAQLSKDSARYAKLVAPRRRHLLAAIDQADEQLKNGREAAAVLDILLTNVRTDATEIPVVLGV